MHVVTNPVLVELPKSCPSCKKIKPAEAFHKDVNTRSGRSCYCRECNKVKRDTPDFKALCDARSRKWRASNPERARLLSAVNSAKERHPVVTIDVDYLLGMLDAQQGLCALSGIKMTFGNTTERGGALPRSCSLDRINQSKGYERGNVRLVCFAMNAFRGAMSDEEMLEMARAALNFLGRV